LDRKQYWIMAIGFGAIIFAECIYYLALTGDPFYRLTLLKAGAVLTDRVTVPFGAIGGSGSLHVWDPIDPIVMFFFKHEFSLIGFASVPALYWTWITKRHERSRPIIIARLFSILALIWLVVNSIALRNMSMGPRYYMMTAYCLFIMIAIWAASNDWSSHRVSLKTWVMIFFAFNLTGIYIDNKNPRFGERSLVEYLGTSTGRIYTDPMTADDINWFCRWAKADCSRVVASPPIAGETYFHNPKNADRPNRFVKPDQVDSYKANSQWPIIWQQDERRKLAGQLIEILGLNSFIPQGILTKLNQPNPTVRVYQVPTANLQRY